MTETPSFVLEGLSSSACDVTIYFITDSIIETQPMTIYRNLSKISHARMKVMGMKPKHLKLNGNSVVTELQMVQVNVGRPIV